MKKIFNLKTTITALTLAASVAASAPTPAKAGIMLMIFNEVSAMAITFTVVGGAGVASAIVLRNGAPALLGALLYFGADGSLNSSQLENELEKEFTFINSHDAIADIAKLVNKKFTALRAINPESKEIMVTLSESDVNTVLEKHALNETLSSAQINQVMQKLTK